VRLNTSLFSPLNYSLIRFDLVDGGPMVNDTLVLNGQLIQEGERFLWWVVDGSPSRVTVSHPARGTMTCIVDGDPKQLARSLAREILGAPRVAELKTVD
jgi:hypothetical protein